MSDAADRGASRPVLQVVAGGVPSDDEIAAVVVAIAARSGAAQADPPATSAWADRAAMLRRPLRHGAGMWRRGG
jgi:hypothetical protein